MCCSSSFEDARSNWRMEDRRCSGLSRRLSASDEKHIKLISLRNQRMSSSAISSELAETSRTQVHPSTIQRSLVRSGLHGRVTAKSHTSHMKRRPRDSTMHKNIGTGVQKNGSRCSGLMGKNVKYLAVAEGSLFANGLESGTIMSVCR